MKKPAIAALAAIAFYSFQPLAAIAAQPLPTPPSISISTINEFTPPFNFVCPESKVKGPIAITGSGIGEAPPGNIDQYAVQVNWGDNTIENGLGVFTPSSGKGPFTFSFSTAPHAYTTDGSFVIKVRLYHSTPPGNDNQADAVATVVLCVDAPPSQPTINIIKDTEPDGEQDFQFSIVSDDLSFSDPFMLDDDADETLPNTKTYVVAPGIYSVQETQIAGWTLTGIACDSQNAAPSLEGASVLITILTAEEITCIFTNTFVPPQPPAPPPPLPPTENTEELCSDGIDNDLDELTDLNDPDCAAFVPPSPPPAEPPPPPPAPAPTENTTDSCSDGIDNDGDGLTDLDDPDCAEFIPPPSPPPPPPPPPPAPTPAPTENTEALCSDGIDNDGDELIDLTDSDCAAFVPPPPPPPPPTPPSDNESSGSSGGGGSRRHGRGSSSGSSSGSGSSDTPTLPPPAVGPIIASTLASSGPSGEDLSSFLENIEENTSGASTSGNEEPIIPAVNPFLANIAGLLTFSGGNFALSLLLWLLLLIILAYVIYVILKRRESRNTR